MRTTDKTNLIDNIINLLLDEYKDEEEIFESLKRELDKHGINVYTDEGLVKSTYSLLCEICSRYKNKGDK